MPCGLILYGVTLAHEMHWIAPIVGTGFVAFGLSVGGAVTMSYILDCYKEIGTQAITSIILIRNIVGFGITWGIQPWITGRLCLFIFGKAARGMTAKRYQSMALKVAVF
ncbi:hypothetical protein LTR78_007698 [Recurvomyces mirabilis]|uniref:Uncharacterized protein n=1 Tax=Recurvomyces mirabilis TaxID=574656 RepID=A0AAE0WHZ8_9PEZI|nr:hypothetical protein LTR78_007698 [Recurvomyces mirabilis]KAK5151585.1 hypothetical protein LTS14_009072 [Recurvomyces mirabilis]